MRFVYANFENSAAPQNMSPGTDRAPPPSLRQCVHRLFVLLMSFEGIKTVHSLRNDCGLDSVFFHLVRDEQTNEWINKLILLDAPTIIGTIGIDADMTIAVFSAGTTLTTVKETETRYRTEINASQCSEGRGKPQRKLRKTDAEDGDTQKPQARRSEIETIASVLSNLCACSRALDL